MRYDAVQLYFSRVRVDNHSRIVSLSMRISNENIVRRGETGEEISHKEYKG